MLMYLMFSLDITSRTCISIRRGTYSFCFCVCLSWHCFDGVLLVFMSMLMCVFMLALFSWAAACVYVYAYACAYVGTAFMGASCVYVYAYVCVYVGTVFMGCCLCLCLCLCMCLSWHCFDGVLLVFMSMLMCVLMLALF